ncbi:hypothetical protein GGE12_005308 [Rhizobium mongolense]|uniref:Uncharacterized protein n=1 Tax=Rhizobium mongolense TaxID=57676 RepID=A0A7W6RSX8_9HYPH|nr:hypothetical protein [Rhizobium mongolense]
MAFQQLSHQPKSGFLVSPALQEGVENIAVGIDGAPQPLSRSLDRHDHLVEVPFVGKAGP